jgi:hypothetical protein
MGKQAKGEQKNNLGQTGSDTDKPAGTTGRQGNTGTENWQQGNTDTNRSGSRPNRHDDDEDSAFGNRTTLR